MSDLDPDLVDRLAQRCKNLSAGRDAAIEQNRELRTLINEAMHLVEYGERAPGGDETWHGWHRKVREVMR